MQHRQPSIDWHAIPENEVFKKLDTQKRGLDEEEARRRLKKYGYNVLRQPARRSLFQRFLAQFNNLLIYVLLASALITAFLQHWIDAGVILSVVLVNAVIGLIQEGKAEKALDAIRKMLSLQAMVIRNDQHYLIEADLLVPGDIVLLRSGDKVPADLRLIECKNLQLQEAILTGESLTVEKAVAPVPPDTGLGDRTSMSYAGTLVTYGKGMGVVVATGVNTEVGKIGTMLEKISSLSTPFLDQINVFGRWLTLFILMSASIIFIFGISVRHYPVIDMFMAAVGLAVAAIPEGLPAIITITLAVGVTRMAKRHAIIRRLPAIETLGSVTVICTDKTGTLTQNELSVQDVVTARNDYHVTGTGYGDQGEFTLEGELIDADDYPDLKMAILASILCNDAVLSKTNEEWRLHGTPVDGALLSLGLKAKLNIKLQQESYLLTDLIPFESEHKFMATLRHDHAGQGYIYIKGAPERILAMCAYQFANAKSEPINKHYWLTQIEMLAQKGQRVIAVAMRLTPTMHRQLTFDDITEEFTMLAILGIMDPPREEAIKAVAECLSAGIRVKMVTGDHAATAKFIGAQLGLKNDKEVLTGYDLDQLTDSAWTDCVNRVDIFARTSPLHKLKLVEALQANQQIVAMTGDGVNDAPALKRANIGIAMGKKGTEAAKEAAEIVLTDDNFASIDNAIREGRTAYDNLWKAILFIIPTNGGEALTIMVAILLGLTLPITPIQILWINMITSVTLALALAFESAEKAVMQRPPRKRKAPIFPALLLWRTLLVASFMMASAFGLFMFALQSHLNLDVARTLAVNTLVINETFYLLNSRKIKDSVLTKDGLFGSKAALGAILIVILFQLVFTYHPWMQAIFGTHAIGIVDWLYIFCVGIVLFMMIEFDKHVVRRRHKV
ncbi:cation-translocating P-type ATPase [Aquicella lusitana]|uniref:Potassium/sodium efflux P-type ATPase n=1 Tax=Aquicella lusitana TaxID=254246 RepID=A0A370GHW2_9COXI|nr:cation-transporting P-type ATPase [Aquicella lusitana]RDI43372.1 potassium/sodium efflux P-type ATPase [Aquicella lusitana]VVC73522.1 putative cation-transporting ATPase F [Aquicella lusitana]